MGSHELPIYYEDTDLSGFVYHANYLKFFERAREHLLGIDFLRRLYTQDGVHFVVSKAELEYKFPARHGDRLLVETRGEYSRSPAIHFVQEAFVKTAEEKRLAVAGKVSIVVLNSQNRPIRMPDVVIENFRQQMRERGY
ncbi:MAG: YbgC/FadM family acyl-CoA thioesterase [Oligoflexus sp.]